MHTHTLRRAEAQETTAPSSITFRVSSKYAEETPQQQEQHRLIAERYAARRRRQREEQGFSPGLRVTDLEGYFEDRFGGKLLPEDDEGKDCVFVIANHLAGFVAPDQRITAWVCEWAPWFGDCAALIEDVMHNPLWWKADTLAKRIGLNNATRMRLGVTTIGATDFSKRKRKNRRRRLKNAARRASRAALGAASHATSAEQRKPWRDLGMSRRSYFYMMAKQKRVQCGETPRDETRETVCTDCTDSRTANLLRMQTEVGRDTGEIVDARLTARHVHHRPMPQHSGPQARAVYAGEKNTTARMDRVDASKKICAPGFANAANNRRSLSMPHVQSAEALKPWLDLGMSRATYYRRRRASCTSGDPIVVPPIEPKSAFADDPLGPKFTAAQKAAYRKLREVLPHENEPPGTRALYEAALRDTSIDQLLECAQWYADINASPKGLLAEFLWWSGSALACVEWEKQQEIERKST